MIYYFMISVLFVSGMFIFIFKYKHLLMMLLSLEMMVISMYFLLYLYMNQFCMDQFLVMLYLVMSVCEGALGVALMVLMIRTHSSDYIMLFDNLW